MKVVVTGGAGFIGSHLCESLLQDGHSVLCLDDLSTSTRKNIEHLLVAPGFVLVEADVADVAIQHLLVGSEAIYHLACPASPIHYQSDHVRTMRTGLLGTMNILDAASSIGARVLFASTSEVYGDPAESPQSESYWGNVNPCGPRSCYDESKRAGEALCFSYSRQLCADARIARIFNTYGPRMARGDGRLIPNFVTQALAGEPLTIYGHGGQTRSLCFVSDTVRGLRAMMDAGLPPEFPINIGNPHEQTVFDIARAVAAGCGSSPRMEFKPLPVDDPRRRCPDISRAKSFLNWSPEVPFAEGLAATIQWFRENP